ncbi:MAG: thioredoxin [Nanoarchaeota archaeon]|nr:thioredoxin [Nanoarchaeota archaeon]
MAGKNYTETEVTHEEFKKIINNSEKVVVVNFFAEWCMPCLMMTPILEDISELMKEVSFVRINVDDNEDLASKHNVSSVPCLIMFKNGKEMDRIIGSHSYDSIEMRIKRCMC